MWWKRSGARELRQLFMDEWDPIHIRGVPEAADEYTLTLVGSRRGCVKVRRSTTLPRS